MGTAMTYEQWKLAVDSELEKLCGMSQLWLPDWLSRDAYDDGLTPLEGAYECLESAGMEYETLIDEA